MAYMNGKDEHKQALQKEAQLQLNGKTIEFKYYIKMIKEIVEYLKDLDIPKKKGKSIPGNNPYIKLIQLFVRMDAEELIEMLPQLREKFRSDS